MPFTPLIPIKNGAREPPPRKTIPKPRRRPPTFDDGRPIPDDQLSPSYDDQPAPGDEYTEERARRMPGLAEPGAMLPKAEPLYPKQLTTEDQLAMALAAQMMPDPGMAMIKPLGAARRRAAPGGLDYSVGNPLKRLLLPETEYSPADAFRTWMEQSQNTDPREMPPEYPIDTYYRGSAGKREPRI